MLPLVVRVVAATLLLTSCSTGSSPAALTTRMPEAIPTADRPSVHTAPAPATYPRDLVPVHDRPCARVPLANDWLRRENALPGTKRWRPDPRSSVQLYLDDPSLACGDTLTVRLGGNGDKHVRVRVLRIGWYAGAGAREVWSSGPLEVPKTSWPRFRDRLVADAAWATTVTTVVAPSWTPGLYVAEAMVDRRATSAAGFVVRNDATPSPLVAVQSNLTWAAYSEAGGASLYRGPTRHGASHKAVVAARAYQVSLLRPTMAGGLMKLLVDDVPLAQVTERLGLPVDHVLDTDLEVRPSVLLGHVGVVLPGHSEYWTQRGFDALQVLESHGVNLADLGANSLYWHARLSTDATGRPLTMTVYRQVALDPLAASHPELATVRWQDRPLSRPSSALVGQAYAAAFIHGGLVLHRPPAWLVAGTAAGDGTLLPNILLNEADGVRATDKAAPPNVQAVALGVLRGKPDAVVSASYASLPSGAGVFDAGTTTWLCAIQNSCVEGHVDPRVSKMLLGMTANLLQDFSRPRWGAAHPSHRDVPASAAALRPLLPREAVGHYGAKD